MTPVLKGELQGKRIVITRPPHKAQVFAEQLAALGAIPLVMPLITIEAVTDTRQLDQKLGDIAAYDWLIITSANTVQHLWGRFAALAISPKLPKIAAVGKSTAKALAKHGAQADLIPDVHTAEALFERLYQSADLSGKRVLLPQGDLAPSFLTDALSGVGANVDPVIAYHTVKPHISPDILNQAFDAITFTSSSTVENFVNAADDPLGVLGVARVVCIGTVTAQTAQAKGLPVHLIAEPHTIEGMIAGMITHFAERTTS